MIRTNKISRSVAVFLLIAMLVSLFPMTAFAVGNEEETSAMQEASVTETTPASLDEAVGDNPELTAEPETEAAQLCAVCFFCKKTFGK